jgi:hypothetical protein
VTRERRRPGLLKGGRIAHVATAFVPHKDPSAHSGHYVARIRTEKDGESSWLLFDDEKVFRALQPLAYLYVFERGGRLEHVGIVVLMKWTADGWVEWIFFFSILESKSRAQGQSAQDSGLPR